MASDFKHEFNDGGEWRPALVVDEHDENNKSFVVFGPAGSSFTSDIAEFVPRGEAAGHFRDRK